MSPAEDEHWNALVDSLRRLGEARAVSLSDEELDHSFTMLVQAAESIDDNPDRRRAVDELAQAALAALEAESVADDGGDDDFLPPLAKTFSVSDKRFGVRAVDQISSAAALPLFSSGGVVDPEWVRAGSDSNADGLTFSPSGFDDPNIQLSFPQKSWPPTSSTAGGVEQEHLLGARDPVSDTVEPLGDGGELRQELEQRCQRLLDDVRTVASNERERLLDAVRTEVKQLGRDLLKELSHLLFEALRGTKSDGAPPDGARTGRVVEHVWSKKAPVVNRTPPAAGGHSSGDWKRSVAGRVAVRSWAEVNPEPLRYERWSCYNDLLSPAAWISELINEVCRPGSVDPAVVVPWQVVSHSTSLDMLHEARPPTLPVFASWLSSVVGRSNGCDSGGSGCEGGSDAWRELDVRPAMDLLYLDVEDRELGVLGPLVRVDHGGTRFAASGSGARSAPLRPAPGYPARMLAYSVRGSVDTSRSRIRSWLPAGLSQEADRLGLDLAPSSSLPSSTDKMASFGTAILLRHSQMRRRGASFVLAEDGRRYHRSPLIAARPILSPAELDRLAAVLPVLTPGQREMIRLVFPSLYGWVTPISRPAPVWHRLDMRMREGQPGYGYEPLPPAE